MDVMTRKLVVLDFNGILCDTVFTGRRYQKVMRPRVEEFVEVLLSRYHVAIFTSSQPRVVHACLRKMSFYKKLEFIWCRDRTWEDPILQRHHTVKLLNDITSEYPTWNTQNVLMVDDSYEKMRYNPSSNYIVPTGVWSYQSLLIDIYNAFRWIG